MILISFYGHDVIGDLMPAITLRPEKIYILYDTRRCRRSDIKNLKDALMNRISDAKAVSVECDSFSVKSVHAAIVKIMMENKDKKVYVDVTGGPELMTAAGCSFARDRGAIPIYLDLDKFVLFEVYNEGNRFPAAEIKLDDYLMAIGARQFSNSHQLPLREEYDNICEMAEYIFDNLSAWSKLEKYLEAAVGGDEIYEFCISRDMFECGYENYRQVEALLDKFCSLGFLIAKSRMDYEIAGKKYKQYLTTYGMWLELYIYINALKYYNEVYLGFIIDWDKDEDTKSNDNEIDVIVMAGSMPVFISCKTRKPEAKDVCEVGFLANRLGGSRARSVLATTYPVKDAGDAVNSIFSRLKKFDVGLIETKDFKKKKAADIFAEAFKSTKSER
ncbi:MAG: DUF1887 family protein [Lachnospiraceae bacterium]|nr:DUF1887 family protein [Lachnospiraceae bacterium]